MGKELQKKIQILQIHKDHLEEKFYIKKIAIFGSFAVGKQKQGSDIDIMIELHQPIGFFKFLEMEEMLAHLLGRRVDLVTKKALKPAIKKTVLKEAIYV